MSSRVWARSGCTSKLIPYTRALGVPKRMPGSLCTQKTLATRHRRQRAWLSGSPPTSRRSKCTMTNVAPAPTGAFMHIYPHGNASCAWFAHSHTRPKACRAPFGRGRLGKQNAVRTILGRLVSSSRKKLRAYWRTPSDRHTHTHQIVSK